MKDHLKEREIIDLAKKFSWFAFRNRFPERLSSMGARMDSSFLSLRAL
jgi:hypothetical protein